MRCNSRVTAAVRRPRSQKWERKFLSINLFVKSMYIKEFDAWNQVKKHLNEDDRKVNIRAGDVRWIAFGVNIGSEIDGKGKAFTRPGLIVDVSGSNYAFVIPMSTRIKDTAGYIPIEFKGKTVSLCVHQCKSISQKRILRRIGHMADSHLQEFKDEVKRFYKL